MYDAPSDQPRPVENRMLRPTVHMRRLIWPREMGREAVILISARGLRGFGDGLVSLILPVYLAALGFSTFEIGFLATATLLGSSGLTLAVGWAVRFFPGRRLLIAGALLMACSGLAVISVEDFWPLVVVAFAGTLSPLAGDASLFLPIEHARLSHGVGAKDRTGVFARYSFVGAIAAAVGSLVAVLPEFLTHTTDMGRLAALKVPFVLYAAIGLIIALLYTRLPSAPSEAPMAPQERLGKSRGVVITLAIFFCIDAFAGGLVVQSLLALWLFQRFGLDLATAGTIFFWIGVSTAFSILLAPPLARRIGLVNVMVFSNLLASAILASLPLMPSLPLIIILLLVRSFVTQLDVPTRTAYVMAVVTPAERAAAATVTSMPRSLAAAAGPVFSGALLSHSDFGWPLVAAGGLKILYNILMYLKFRNFLPEEAQPETLLPPVETADPD